MSEAMVLKKPSELDVPRLQSPKAIFKDWDRVLGNVDNSLGRLYAVAERRGVDVRSVKEEYAQSVQDGGSYSPVKAVRERLADLQPPVSVDQIRKDFREYRPQHPEEEPFKLTYKDAPGLVGRVDASGNPYMVPTYGVDKDWQLGFKIGGSGFSGHAEVLSSKYKGPYIGSLVSPRETFDFYAIRDGKVTAIVEAKSGVLIDDKVVSFEGLPDNCTGYLLRRPEEPVLEAQRGDWPEELTIAGLGQLVMDDGELIRIEEPLQDHPDTMPRANTLYVPIQYGLAA
jgi:hypothetical protein